MLGGGIGSAEHSNTGFFGMGAKERGKNEHVNCENKILSDCLNATYHYSESFTIS